MVLKYSKYEGILKPVVASPVQLKVTQVNLVMFLAKEEGVVDGFFEWLSQYSDHLDPDTAEAIVEWMDEERARVRVA
jgi:hypothetical protein